MTSLIARRAAKAALLLQCALAGPSLLGCRERAESSTESAPAPSLALPRVRWQGGRGYHYAFSLVTRIEVADAPTGSLSVRGALEVWPSTEDDSEWLSLRFTELTFDAPPGVDASEFATLRAELMDHEHAARLAGGILAEQVLDAGTTPVAANLVRTLFSALQFPTGDPSLARIEVDSTGGFESRYEVTSPRQVLKRKLRYVSLNAVGQREGPHVTVPLPELNEATVAYELDADSIAHVHASESIESRIAKRSVLKGKNELRLDYGGPAKTASPSLALLRSRGRSWGASEAYVAGDFDAQFDPLRTSGLGFDEALAEIASIAKATGGDFASSKDGVPLDPATRELRKDQLARHARAFAALSAHLRGSAELVERAVRALRSSDPTQAALLVDALGAASSDAAQAALVKIVGTATYPARLRGAAANGLVRVEHPIREVEAALLALTRHPELAEFGLYSLGALSRRLREQGQVERAAAVDAALVKELGSADNASQRRRVLLGMSNAGSRGLLPAIEPELQSADPEVVAAAVTALRLIDAPEVDVLLVGQLKSKERSLRRRVLDTIQSRSPSDRLLSAVVELANAGEVGERIRAIRVLGHWRTSRAEAELALRSLAERDELEKVRLAARGELPG